MERPLKSGELEAEAQPACIAAFLEGVFVFRAKREERETEIEAGKAGTVTQILVENGQPVEYGQPLFVIE